MSQTRTETPPTRPPLDDTEVVDPAEGFGQLWHKHYEVSLEGTGHSPEEIIRIWRDRYGEFWPEGNHFQRPLAGLRPNEMAVSELEMPAGTTLTTGVIVDEVNPTSFSFKTPKGHTFAGSIRFYAKNVNAEPVAGLDIIMRASDPLFELGMPLGGHRREDKFWIATLTNLARALGSTASPIVERTLLDSHRHWRNVGNIRHNGLLHTALARVRTALGRLTGRASGNDTPS